MSSNSLTLCLIRGMLFKTSLPAKLKMEASQPWKIKNAGKRASMWSRDAEWKKNKRRIMKVFFPFCFYTQNSKDPASLITTLLGNSLLANTGTFLQKSLFLAYAKKFWTTLNKEQNKHSKTNLLQFHILCAYVLTCMWLSYLFIVY